MKRLHYEVSIDAPRNRVWEVLWSEETYGKWTAPFDEGSRAISDWEEGSKVLFLSAKGYGMYSKIRKNICRFFGWASVGDLLFRREFAGEIVKRSLFH